MTLVDLARAYHARINPAWPFDPDAFLRVAESLPFFEATEDGFIGGTVGAHPLSPGWIVAQEILWFANGSGGNLARSFRRWAKANGANEIMWSCPPDSRAEKHLDRIGKRAEAVFSEAI